MAVWSPPGPFVGYPAPVRPDGENRTGPPLDADLFTALTRAAAAALPRMSVIGPVVPGDGQIAAFDLTLSSASTALGVQPAGSLVGFTKTDTSPNTLAVAAGAVTHTLRFKGHTILLSSNGDGTWQNLANFLPYDGLKAALDAAYMAASTPIPPAPDWLPGDVGLAAWTGDPAVYFSFAPSSGTLFLARLRLRSAATISNIMCAVSAAGATLTAGQNLMGLFDASFKRLGVTADQTGPFGSVGLKTAALTSPVVCPAGDYYVGLLSVGSTAAAFGAHASTTNGPAAAINVGRTLANPRGAVQGGQTGMPSPAAPSALSAVVWAALS